MEQTEKEFPRGIRFEKPREGAPDLIKGRIGIFVADFVEYLTAKKDERGWVNLDLKMSKGGKLYLDLNDWKPEAKADASQEIKDSDIPF